MSEFEGDNQPPGDQGSSKDQSLAEFESRYLLERAGFDATLIGKVLKFNKLLGNYNLAEALFAVRAILKNQDNPTHHRDSAKIFMDAELRSYDELSKELEAKGIVREDITPEMIPPGYLRVELMRMDRGDFINDLQTKYAEDLSETAQEDYEARAVADIQAAAANLSPADYSEFLDLLGIEKIEGLKILFKPEVVVSPAAKLAHSDYIYRIGSRIGEAWREHVSLNPMQDSALHDELREIGVGVSDEYLDNFREFVTKSELQTLMALINGGNLRTEFLTICTYGVLDKIREKIPQEKYKVIEKDIIEILSPENISAERVYTTLANAMK